MLERDMAAPTSPRRITPVLLFELSMGLCFLAFLGVFLWRLEIDDAGVPLSSADLAVGPSQDRWYGIYFQEQHVGWSMSRTSATADGGSLFEQRSSFRVATFGKLQEIITAGAALVDAKGELRRFDFFMAADALRLSARGEVKGKVIDMQVTQAGETSSLQFDVENPPQVGASLEAAIARETLFVGHHFSVPYFDPVTMAQGEMEMVVTDVAVLESGDEAWWMRSTFAGMETRSLVSASGEILRQEGGLGLATVRMAEAEARAVPTQGEPVDLISLSAVPLEGFIRKPRNVSFLSLIIAGVENERVPHDPPLQVREGDSLQLTRFPLERLGTEPLLAFDEQNEYLLPTVSLPTAHPEIQTQAQALVEGASDRTMGARQILDFVYQRVEKVPSVGVPNGLEVLRRMEGDCNEHTALYVSLARAAGIPARIAAGVVFSDRIGAKGAFYYHAWPEVQIGQEGSWVPLDPTFGQFPADATHIKLVEGDLDRQVEIMAFLGRLGFELVKVEAVPLPGGSPADP